ncbi:MAG: sigma-70 family RNA polymerase sigma factor [Bacteroidota bacterium]
MSRKSQPNYINGLLQHDTATIELIYRNYASRIQLMVKANGGTAEDARDIIHDALMIVYQKAQTPDFQLTSQFYSYLYGICLRLWDRKRKKKSSQTVTIPNDHRYRSDEDLLRDIEAREQHLVFRSALRKLGPLCQQLLELFFAKTDMAEIARQLDLKNAHTARNRKYRCQKELEQLVKSDVRYSELKH